LIPFLSITQGFLLWVNAMNLKKSPKNGGKMANLFQNAAICVENIIITFVFLKKSNSFA
jgi:hypothetical protein